MKAAGKWRALAAQVALVGCGGVDGMDARDAGAPKTDAGDAGDREAPRTMISVAPVDPTNSTLATFVFDCSEADCTFTCALDGARPAPCTSPVRWEDLAESRHRATFAAADPAGNVESPPLAVEWTIDVTPPETVVDSSPPATTTSSSAQFVFHCGDPQCAFICELDHGVYRHCTSPHVVNGLSQGDHVMIIRAEDAAGNRDPSAAELRWTVLP